MDPFARRVIVDTHIRELQAEAAEQRLAAACRRSEALGSDGRDVRPRWLGALLRRQTRSGVRPTATIVGPAPSIFTARRTLGGRSQ